MRQREPRAVCRRLVKKRASAHRWSAEYANVVVKVRTAATAKRGPALEAPAGVNVGQSVGAAARGGSEFVQRHHRGVHRGIARARAKVTFSAIGLNDGFRECGRIDRVIDAAAGIFGVVVEIDNARQELPGGIRCKVRISGLD